jgi:branched-chain amino acid aminotransferase
MFPEINFIRTVAPKEKPADESRLGFGSIFTDHMFMMDYVEGQGWINPTIKPYEPLLLPPSAMIFHYGQAIFEGMKAYRRADGGINLFRPALNFERMNHSNARMGIPQIDEAFFLHCLNELILVEQDWVPHTEGTSLYIRPFIIATDPHLGVRASYTYKYMVILSPSGPYYPQGINPVNIYIEDRYVRAVRGGTGEAKCPGNYAAGLLAQEVAEEKGFVQVLWLDGIEQKYIEEVGSMNVFFVIGDELVTPALNGSILSGITRRSVIELAQKWGVAVSERKISVEELIQRAEAGEISEAFGSGTAAVISPIGELMYEDRTFVFNEGRIGALSRRLYDTITGLQYGQLEDDLNWVYRLN